MHQYRRSNNKSWRVFLHFIFFLTICTAVDHQTLVEGNLTAIGIPYFVPNETMHVQIVTVRIYTDTIGAQIRYTLDDTNPGVHSLVYAPGDHIVIDKIGITNIRAIGFKEGMLDSPMALKKYVIIDRCKPPVMTPPGGTYAGSIAISLSSETHNAIIYYTLDGSIPTSNSQYVHNLETITISEGSVKLRAIALQEGKSPSTITSETYTILPKVTTPVINPPIGSFTISATLTITCVTPNTTIYYSTDGRDPTENSLTLPHGHQIIIGDAGKHTIKALATHPTMLASDIAIKKIMIFLRTPTPRLHPHPGTYTNSVHIVYKCFSEDSSSMLYYTTDGTSTPTMTSPSMACDSTPGLVFTAPTRVVIRAFAKAADMSASAIKEFIYDVVHPRYDTFPMKIPSSIDLLQIQPDVAMTALSKDMTTSSTKTSTSTIASDQCVKRVVNGRLVMLHNPIGHFDILTPIGGCGTLNTISFTARDIDSHHIETTATAIELAKKRNGIIHKLLLNATDLQRQQFMDKLDMNTDTITNNICHVATSVGNFNMTSGACLDNLITSSGSRAIHTISNVTTSFGIRDGEYVIGYMDSADIGNTSSHSFDMLISGNGWLVRNGRSYISEYMKDAIHNSGSGSPSVSGMIGDMQADMLMARSAIGYDSSGSLLLLHVEGRTGETGMTLLEFAAFAVEMGFESALNLLGGESVAMVANQTIVSGGTSKQCKNGGGGGGERSSEYVLCEPRVSSISCIRSLSRTQLFGYNASDSIYHSAGGSGSKDTSSSLINSHNSQSPSSAPSYLRTATPSSLPTSTPTVQPSPAPNPKPNPNPVPVPVTSRYTVPTPYPSPNYWNNYNNNNNNDDNGNGDWAGAAPDDGISTSMDSEFLNSNATSARIMELQMLVQEYQFATLAFAIAFITSMIFHIQRCFCSSKPKVDDMFSDHTGVDSQGQGLGSGSDHDHDIPSATGGGGGGRGATVFGWGGRGGGGRRGRGSRDDDEGLYEDNQGLEMQQGQRTMNALHDSSQHSNKLGLSSHSQSSSAAAVPVKYIGEKGWQAQLQSIDFDKDSDDDEDDDGGVDVEKDIRGTETTSHARQQRGRIQVHGRKERGGHSASSYANAAAADSNEESSHRKSKEKDRNISPSNNDNSSSANTNTTSNTSTHRLVRARSKESKAAARKNKPKTNSQGYAEVREDAQHSEEEEET